MPRSFDSLRSRNTSPANRAADTPNPSRTRPSGKRRRSPLLLFLLLLFWSAILGWGLSQATLSASLSRTLSAALVQRSGAQNLATQIIAQTPAAPATPVTPVTLPTEGMVDPVPERYRFGLQLYLENCATCHVGLPPAVMPSQTWAVLLQDSQHYGAQIQPLVEPSLQIVWSYVSTYSRPIIERERVPFRLQQSRYFKALHPGVEFTSPPDVYSCLACHPAAAQFNYRSLAAEWEGG